MVLLENLTHIREKDYCKLILQKLKTQILCKISPIIPKNDDEKLKTQNYFRK